MQADLDDYFRYYNHERPHQGRNMNGRTPYTAFIESLPKDEESDTENLNLAA
jgi:hypothetical protein